MNEFRVFAHGVAFNSNEYLETAPIEFDGVWVKGEAGHDHPKSSGVYKMLGDGRKLTIIEQQKVAIEYLSANREALKALAQHPDVTTFVLGLQYHIELDESTIGFCMSPSALLMWHALDIGIDITFYVSLDRRNIAMFSVAEPHMREES